MLDPVWVPSSRPTYVAHQARSVAEMFVLRARADAPRVAFEQRRAGQWVPCTWQQFHDRAAAVASFLIDRGVAPGDKVCIIGDTRPEWCYCDIGGLLAGAVTLGAYSTLTAAQTAFILDHADARVAFVQGAADVDKILTERSALPGLELVCVWDTEGLDEKLAENDWLIPFERVLAHPVASVAVDDRVSAIDPDSTAIIVYTSGTTGPPKGAMISHRNIVTCLECYQDMVPFDRDDVSLNFLPMAHVAERVAGFYGRINAGIATSFATSVPRVIDEIREVRPTVFGSVPRIFEKAYDRIMAEVDRAPAMRQRVFRWAERVGREVVRRWQGGRPVPLILAVQYRLADRLVFRRLRAVFGGRVRHFITGAAPIAGEILEFFWAAGFPIYEAYGMTEATVITHCNRPGRVRLGSVGQPVAVVEDRIADDGEILIRGAAVFQGYYKDPGATDQVIDPDGWLHTGDIGRRDADGYIYISDRKKHIIITAGGKNLSPANIENEIKAADPLISQVHAHGDRRPYLTALVTIGPAEAVEYARSRGLLDGAAADDLLATLAANPLARPDTLHEVTAQIAAEPALQRRIVAAVERANQRLAKVETIKKIHLLDREFSLEEDEITPTLKVKRKVIETRFADVFDRLYSEDSFGLVVSPRK